MVLCIQKTGTFLLQRDSIYVFFSHKIPFENHSTISTNEIKSICFDQFQISPPFFFLLFVFVTCWLNILFILEKKIYLIFIGVHIEYLIIKYIIIVVYINHQFFVQIFQFSKCHLSNPFVFGPIEICFFFILDKIHAHTQITNNFFYFHFKLFKLTTKKKTFLYILL